MPQLSPRELSPPPYLLQLLAERKRERPFLVATKAFSVRDDDGTIVSVAVGEGVAADHRFVRWHPECFEPESGAPARAITTPAAQVAPTSVDDGPTVELRTEASREVTLSESARRTIIDYARATEDGRETGGTLYGVVKVGGLNDVVSARGPGPKAKRGLHSFRHDGEHDALEAARVAREVDGMSDYREVGAWHTHPTCYKDGQPSEADLRAWAGMLSAFGARRFTPRYVAFIVEPSRDPSRAWRYPEIHAWVTSRNPRAFGAEYVCERAVIR